MALASPRVGLPDCRTASCQRRLILSLAKRASGSPSAPRSSPASAKSGGKASPSDSMASAIALTQKAAQLGCREADGFLIHALLLAGRRGLRRSGAPLAANWPHLP